jgi:hypothetical protein
MACMGDALRTSKIQIYVCEEVECAGEREVRKEDKIETLAGDDRPLMRLTHTHIHIHIHTCWHTHTNTHTYTHTNTHTPHTHTLSHAISYTPMASQRCSTCFAAAKKTSGLFAENMGKKKMSINLYMKCIHVLWKIERTYSSRVCSSAILSFLYSIFYFKSTWEVSDQRPILGRGLKFFFPVLLIHSKTLTKNRKVKKRK